MNIKDITDLNVLYDNVIKAFANCVKELNEEEI